MTNIRRKQSLALSLYHHFKNEKRIIYSLDCLISSEQRHNVSTALLSVPYTVHCKTLYRKFEKELRGLSPNSYIHVSVSDLYTKTYYETL
jgi:hypothetical protein